MPFIIPNATDIDGSNFIALDQSEPDSLDFQILGDRSTGVLTGCAVSTVTGTTIKVDQGAVAIQGVVYNVPVFNQVTLPTAPLTTTYRFDVVIARLNTTTSVISIVVVSGPESTTNPTFPKTPSRLSSLVGVDYINIGNITTNNPTTDVVLATVFRNAAAAISNACIVDKRVNVPSTTSLRGATNPDNTIGNDGDLYYRTTEVVSSSGVFIKTNGAWVELLLQNNSGSVTPIGSIIMWPSNVTTPNPTGKTFWLECLGQEVAKSSYSALSILLGTTYNTPGTTISDAMFKLPNLSSGFIQGAQYAGSTGGSGSVSIAEGNLPAHAHGIDNHQHPVGEHAHKMVHKHATQDTVKAGSHTHNPALPKQDGLNTGGFVTKLNEYITGTWEVVNNKLKGVTGFLIPHSYDSDGLAPDGIDEAFLARGMQVHYTTGLEYSIEHKHEIKFDEYDGNTGLLKTTFTNANPPVEIPNSSLTGVSSGNTGDGPGTGEALLVIPPYITMRWFIRAL